MQNFFAIISALSFLAISVFSFLKKIFSEVFYYKKLIKHLGLCNAIEVDKEANEGFRKNVFGEKVLVRRSAFVGAEGNSLKAFSRLIGIENNKNVNVNNNDNYAGGKENNFGNNLNNNDFKRNSGSIKYKNKNNFNNNFDLNSKSSINSNNRNLGNFNGYVGNYKAATAAAHESNYANLIHEASFGGFQLNSNANNFEDHLNSNISVNMNNSKLDLLRKKSSDNKLNLNLDSNSIDH